MSGGGFLLGLLTGGLLWVCVVWWFLNSPRSPVVVLERWWLEDEERWASVRRQEMDHQSVCPNCQRPNDHRYRRP